MSKDMRNRIDEIGEEVNDICAKADEKRQELKAAIAMAEEEMQHAEEEMQHASTNADRAAYEKASGEKWTAEHKKQNAEKELAELSGDDARLGELAQQLSDIEEQLYHEIEDDLKKIFNQLEKKRDAHAHLIDAIRCEYRRICEVMGDDYNRYRHFATDALNGRITDAMQRLN